MITVILKNTTLHRLTYAGRVIPASGQKNCSGATETLREDDDLFAAIDAGDIVINDGTTDLSAEKGKAQLYAPLFGEVTHPFYMTIDRQMADAATKFVTTSRTMVDLDSMTLTTKDLGEDGNYVITFSCDYKHQGDDKECHFALSIGGVEVSVGKAVGYKKNKKGSFAMTHRENGVSAGTVIKIQVSQESTDTRKDELTVTDRRLVIDGVKDGFVL